jgi:hypothetical protein
MEATPIDYAQWSVATLTGLLAIATFVLAWHTWRMAQVARRSLALETRPFLAFDSVGVLTGTPQRPELTPFIKLHNVGRVLVRFRVEVFEANTNGVVPPNPSLNAAEGVIFPGLSTEYSGPAIPGIDATKDFSGHVRFKLTYWSAPGSEKYRIEEDADFHGNASVPWARWTRTRTPHYT